MTLPAHVILAVIIIIFSVWWWYKANKNKQFYQHVPAAPGLLFLGHALEFKSSSDILKNFMKYIKKHGDLIHIRLGPFLKCLVVADYKLLEFLLSTTKIMNKSEIYDSIRCWLGNGLLTADEHIWRKHRRILNPAFHFQMLEQFIQVFDTQAEKLLKKLELDDGTVDIYPYLSLCSLDIICETIMGVSINAQDNSTSDYVKSVHAMCKIAIERSMSMTEINDFVFKLTRNYQKQKQIVKILHDKSNGVINQRRVALDDVPNGAPDDETVKRRKLFLDVILSAKIENQSLTQEEIRDEVDTFLFAGHDTTAAALGFTLYCLANHPEVQRMAYDEQESIFLNEPNQHINYSNLQAMKYLEMVIKESLRLYPPVPIIGRRTYEDVIYDGKILPRGDTIILFIYGIHRNPKYFPDPDVFNPNRFESLDGSTPYAYIPFSAGPRNCIGQKFAMLEVKGVISKILRKFELLPAVPAQPLELIAETVLKSKNGINVRLKKRT